MTRVRFRFRFRFRAPQSLELNSVSDGRSVRNSEALGLSQRVRNGLTQDKAHLQGIKSYISHNGVHFSDDAPTLMANFERLNVSETLLDVEQTNIYVNELDRKT